MKILAVDTTSYGCSVAVVEGGEILSEHHSQKRETHSKHLLRLIDDVLETAGLDIQMVDGFAVAKGPGSFTGLRIGISTLKGLAAALEKPLAGVSSLKVLAAGVPSCRERICAVIDARKNEIYASFFNYTDNSVTRLSEEFSITPEKLAGEIDRPIIFVGSGVETYKNTFKEIMGDKALFLADNYNFINAVNVGRLAATDLSENKAENLHTLLPNYIRKSDAEINLKKK